MAGPAGEGNAMSASDQSNSSANAIGVGAEAIDEIARSLTLPRALIEANLRVGSALVGFASRCIHAEADFLEQLFRRRDLDQASSLHARFVAAMIGEGGRELTELMAVARANVALIADAAAPTARSAS
jgi:hypothetical protein